MAQFGHKNISSMTSSVSTENVSNGSQIGLNDVAHTMLSNLEVGIMMRLRHPRIVTFLGAGEVVIHH